MCKRERGWGRDGGEWGCRGPGRQLLGGERLDCGAALAAALHLSSSAAAERAAVDEEAFDPAGMLGERLAEDRGPAFVGRALAGARRPQFQMMSRAMNALGRRAGRLGGIGRGGGRSRGERQLRKERKAAEASRILLFSCDLQLTKRNPFQLATIFLEPLVLSCESGRGRNGSLAADRVTSGHRRVQGGRAALPIPPAVELIGEKWAFLILRGALNGLQHFEEFQAGLGIARNILSDRLAKLVAGGILERDGRSVGQAQGRLFADRQGRGAAAGGPGAPPMGRGMGLRQQATSSSPTSATAAGAQDLRPGP